MRRFTLCRRMLAVALVVVIVTLRLGSLSHETFVKPVQDFISKTAYFSEDDQRPKFPLVKPKRALADAFLGNAPDLEPYLPPISRLIVYTPFTAIPEVYLEIFIPPDEAA